jgi:probable F420-dependent oxidoreductase
VKVDLLAPDGIRAVGPWARRVEAAGYRGAWIGETKHEPFLLALRAIDATASLDVGTAVVIALGRSPLTVAHSGYDLACASGGRFQLGLGSQVRSHIERRFSMPWSAPAARMREFVLAVRAIWRTWEQGEPLRFEGDFYHHTLMTPVFSPAQHKWGPPPLLLAGSGERMVEVAGEVADGFVFHPFSTAKHLQEVQLPALRRGRARRERAVEPLIVSGPVFVATAWEEEELAERIQAVRQEIAFYGSTPAYRSVLAHHGWEDLQPELTALSKEGRWGEMGGLVDDAVLHAFAAVGEPPAVAAAIAERFEGLVDRVTLHAPGGGRSGAVDEVAVALASGKYKR